MSHYSLENDTFRIERYNQAAPFASFLPGIAGVHGKPLWVFYTNRGQCIASFGIRNKNNAMQEFYPANKAYQATPLLGFRTFLRLQRGKQVLFYEPFQTLPREGVEQTLAIRPSEIELVETHSRLGIRISIVFFTPANEALPVLLRSVIVENRQKAPVRIEMVDGLPNVVPFGLNDYLLKHMSRTMEAFTEVRHGKEQLPYFKLKTEPGDTAEVKWIHEGFFSFALHQKRSLPMVTDPENIFGSETSLQIPLAFQTQRRFMAQYQRTETLTPSAFSVSSFTLARNAASRVDSVYGHVASWEAAARFRKEIVQTDGYVDHKRQEIAALIRQLTDAFALHAGIPQLDAYSRQAFLDNTLRGGQPYVIPQTTDPNRFHYFTRKHGDMERDYNFFELSPTYYSQGNGNFRDVNQNRRSDGWVYGGVHAGNVETFFNLLQLDGFNPLVIQYEKFYLDRSQASGYAGLDDFLTQPFSPGELFEQLFKKYGSTEKADQDFRTILGQARKVQEASHGEGYWVDHWTYNLDLLENFFAVYPDEKRQLFMERRTFTYYDNDHVVQPRSKKYIQRRDGSIRQLQAVVQDPEKRDLLKRRTAEPHKVRTDKGQGEIYQTSLFVKVMGLVAIKTASLDPFGVGLEMESDKPGWCDALNGLPSLFGSSTNESFELLRWMVFLREELQSLLGEHETHLFPVEIADLLKTVSAILAKARLDSFYASWDALATAREHFREQTRLGISGEEVPVTRAEVEAFLHQAERVLNAGLDKACAKSHLCPTYFTHGVVRFEPLPVPAAKDPRVSMPQTVKVLEFKQTPIAPFLEGPVHALRVVRSVAEAKKIYTAVRSSDLYDRKLKMFRLNAPLEKESFEIGRARIFSPGWLENESIFLHMAYKFLLETLRSGLAEEFFDDFKNGIIAFQKPERYGRSILENSSFIASSRFPDARVHGRGFVSRLTGATAEWMSMVLYMGLGRRPFQWNQHELRFAPQPTLAGWLFDARAKDGFEKDTFGFKLFGKTWIVYRNPGRRNTFGAHPLKPVSYLLHYEDGREILQQREVLGSPYAQDLRDGKLSRLTITLG